MSKTTISNARMASFCDTIVRQVRELLYDREEDILNAWHENIEEANTNEKDFPAMKIGIGATIDLEGSTIETAIRFTATYVSRLSEGLPDPNQPELPGVDQMAADLGKAIKKAGAKVTSKSSK